MGKSTLFLAFACIAAPGGLWAANSEHPPAMLTIKRLSLESALTMAKAALERCRDAGVQVAVTVIDRGGHPQVVLRDVLTMDLALTVSQQKAYTAMSFNTATSELENRFSMFSVPKIDGVLIARGGLPITAGGTILGGIGVSGSPDGKIDEQCAQAGVDAIQDELEMEGG